MVQCYTKLLICMCYLECLVHVNEPVATTAMLALEKSISKSSRITAPPLMQDIQLSPLLCSNSSIYKRAEIICTNGQPLLAYPYCATYSEVTELLSLEKCPYFQIVGHNATLHEQMILPRNLSQLNDYMCGPVNRKGLVCAVSVLMALVPQ